MEDIFLSVIVPVYNSGKYLPTCIDGFAAANIPDMELLLVDDGSTDGSRELCEFYSEKYSFIRCIQQKNSGPSTARNRGIENTSGEYVTFADSDDYINPKAFACTVSKLRAARDTDLLASDFCRVADNGCVLDRVYQIRESSEPIVDAKYLMEFLKAPDCTWNVWRYIFRREYLDQNSLRFAEGFDCAEDLEFMTRALFAGGRLAFFHSPYYYYRVNYGATLTRRCTPERAGQLMEMLTRSAEFLQSVNTPEAQLLLGKLAREAALNLALYCEVPRRGRDRARVCFERAPELMAMSGGKYGSLAAVVRLAGIPAASHAVLALKRVKRAMRGVKVAAHGLSVRMNGGSDGNQSVGCSPSI